MTDGEKATDEASGESAEESEDRAEEPVDVLTRTEEIVEKIESKEDEDDLGPLLSELDDIEDFLDEAEDLLSTTDLSEFVRAVDWEALPDAVDPSNLPGAIRDGDVGAAIDGRELLSAVDLSALFDSVDEREFWRQKREFDEELGDVTGEESPDGSADSAFEADLDVDRDGMGDDVDPRAIQAAVQREISGAVGEFREKLIEAHDRLEELREANEDRFDERRTKSYSRNPTAGFSTLPAGNLGSGGAARFSSVPEETRYSTAPNRKRIYGDRFESAGGDDGG